MAFLRRSQIDAVAVAGVGTAELLPTECLVRGAELGLRSLLRSGERLGDAGA